MEKEMEKFKEIDSLRDLPTKRLLAYYKARRKDKFRFEDSHCCDCCGSTSWELYPKDTASIKAKETIESMEMYLAKVRDLLSEREHVKK